MLACGYLLALAPTAPVVGNPTACLVQALGEETLRQSDHDWVVVLVTLGSIIGFGVCCWSSLGWCSCRNVLSGRSDLTP